MRRLQGLEASLNQGGRSKLLAIGLADDNPACLVEHAVNNALKEVMAEAEQRLLDRFGEVTIGAFSREMTFPDGVHSAEEIL